MVRTVAGQLRAAGRVGLLPAAFHPPTTAHLALAGAAQEAFDLEQVVFVLPELMPHKRIARPSVEQRLQWLAALAGSSPDRAAAACRAGLVVEIVQALRGVMGDACEVFVICGRDAAERYASWDYGAAQSFAEQLLEYRLLVASRGGAYAVPPEYAGRILTFEIDPQYDDVSSRAVREAIYAGRSWRRLVPRGIRDSVEAAYGGARG